MQFWRPTARRHHVSTWLRKRPWRNAGVGRFFRRRKFLKIIWGYNMNAIIGLPRILYHWGAIIHLRNAIFVMVEVVNWSKALIVVRDVLSKLNIKNCWLSSNVEASSCSKETTISLIGLLVPKISSKVCVIMVIMAPKLIVVRDVLYKLDIKNWWL